MKLWPILYLSLDEKERENNKIKSVRIVNLEAIYCVNTENIPMDSLHIHILYCNRFKKHTHTHNLFKNKMYPV